MATQVNVAEAKAKLSDRLDVGELLGFVRDTQPEAEDELVALHGTDDKAGQRLAKRVADELTGRGTVDVLRRGVTDLVCTSGCNMRNPRTS